MSKRCLEVPRQREQAAWSLRDLGRSSEKLDA